MNKLKSYTHNKRTFISGLLGGVCGAGLLLGGSYLLPKAIQEGANGGIVMVDSNKIIRNRSLALGKKGLSQAEIQQTIIEFIGTLDDAMNSLSAEKSIVLLKPEGVASFRVPDMTDEVVRRIYLQESKERGKGK